jgi:hypothetical protein
MAGPLLEFLHFRSKVDDISTREAPLDAVFCRALIQGITVVRTGKVDAFRGLAHFVLPGRKGAARSLR